MPQHLFVEAKAKAAVVPVPKVNATKEVEKAKAETKKATKSVTAKVPTTDKATGTYNGKTVYTGPKGGRYYINANGNKTYLSEDKK